jgi:hypothetical protein
VKITARNALCSVQLIAAVAFVTACDRIVDPALPSTAAQFVPPPVYDKWWTMVETCSGVKRPLGDVSWFGIPGSLFQLGDQVVTGYWTAGANRIVLADSARLDGSVVRHEMLHALIRQNGHPRSAFLEKCAGLVSCTPECVADAGPYTTVSVGIATVPPDSINVSVEILPNPPTFAVDGGVFSMVVSAHNPATHPVNVLLPTINGLKVAAFAYDIRGFTIPAPRIGGTFELLDPSATTFEAGETKRHYFDFNIGTIVRNRTVAPAGYKMTGSYGTHSVTLSPIVIAPP